MSAVPNTRGQDEDTSPEKKVSAKWSRYLDAELGLRNHWYPAFFSADLDEADTSGEYGEPVANVRVETLLGERILFRRVDGEVLAVEDRCLHRGVALSRRPECYTPGTVTCWYHGFTYDLDDGNLRSVISDPDCGLIGKVALRTYPTAEHAGLVFVFIGDEEPPPLMNDLQPALARENFAVYPRGWVKEVRCNWRLAAENGFDPAHAYIHRNSPVVVDYKVPTVLGDTGITRKHGMEVVDSGERRGVRLLRGAGTPIWEADVADGVKVAARYRPEDEGVLEGMVPEVSVWMPCGLEVDPFPYPGTVHFEWYVPIDRETHRYIITWGRTVANDGERKRFFAEMDDVWSELVPNSFNNDDVMAREAMHDFYDRDGWQEEQLFGPDIVITSWRSLVARHARGTQTPDDAWALPRSAL